MSFIAYLCWLLGIAVPTDCDASNYGAYATEQCGTQANVEPPKEEGKTNAPEHHARRTNIDLSI